jgi:hypothetical protein
MINELVQLGRALDGLRDLSLVEYLALRQLDVLVLLECLLDHEAIIVSGTRHVVVLAAVRDRLKLGDLLLVEVRDFDRRGLLWLNALLLCLRLRFRF